MLRSYADKLKNAVVEVGINMLFTIGHCYYADENEAGFRRAVTMDGEASRGCVCMRDKNIAAYIKEIYSYYAALKPSVIFADDDIRAISLGQLTCFCTEHLRLISEKVGKKLTLAAVREHILHSGYEVEKICL